MAADSKCALDNGGRQWSALARRPTDSTQCGCGRNGTPQHYSHIAMEVVFPGSPESIHNLMYRNRQFTEDFLVNDQGLLDLKMSEWSPVEPSSNLQQRTVSYIKPLNGTMGPKQTKCEIRDENTHVDFEQYTSTVTSTRTPDVPSGNVFTVETRTCIMWATPVSTKVLVTSEVRWTGRSVFKGIIERRAMEGQRAYQVDLERAMRAYIQAHMSEFLPKEAVGVWDVERNAPQQGEHRSLPRWNDSSITVLLCFVIVVLGVSNLWAFARLGNELACKSH